MSVDTPKHDDESTAWSPASPRRQPSPDEHDDLTIPRARPVIDIKGYEILRELSRAGQGVVYQAVSNSTGRRVAIKVLRHDKEAAETNRKRFEREIRLVAQFQHPNIILVFDSGETPDGQHYYIMDYVRGVSLRDYVREHKLSLEATLALMRTVCNAVHHVHQRGVIHRDLKPANIMVDSEGAPKVLDFGLAKAMLTPPEAMVSITGQFVGTLTYMSPEQTHGNPDEIDGRSDVYSLGVILYELVTGRHPYPPTGQMADLLKHIVELSPTPPSKAWDPQMGLTRESGESRSGRRSPIDADLETIILKAQTKDRQRRYQSAEELSRDIDHYLRGEPIDARRDSAIYVLRKRSRGFVQRHVVTSFLGAIAIAPILTELVAPRAVFSWTQAGAEFEAFLTRRFPPTAIGSWFENVRVIALTDSTPVEALAREAGIEGVTVENKKSLRRLHGRLMERLAERELKPRTVAWDFKFSGESEFDEAFAVGARALGEVGVDVIVGVDTSWLEGEGVQDLSSTIAPEVRCGLVTANPQGAWSVHLAAQRGPANPVPGLPLAAFASYQHPATNYDIRFREDGSVLDLVFWYGGAAHARHWLGDPDRVVLSDATAIRPDTEPYAARAGYKLDDLVASHIVTIPAEHVLNESTVAYETIFTPDDDTQVQTQLADKVVVLGDLRGDTDRHLYADRRMVAGCYAHATVIDALLRKFYIRRPRLSHRNLIALTAAILGCLTGVLMPRGWVGRWLALAGWAVVLMAAGVLAYRNLHYLLNPFVPLFTLVVACELSAAVKRVYLRRILFYYKKGGSPHEMVCFTWSCGDGRARPRLRESPTNGRDGD